jgi:hypothetical protein
MVYARRLTARLDAPGPLLTRWLPLASSAVITRVGAAIALQALTAGGVSAGPSEGPGSAHGGGVGPGTPVGLAFRVPM